MLDWTAGSASCCNFEISSISLSSMNKAAKADVLVRPSSGK